MTTTSKTPAQWMGDLLSGHSPVGDWYVAPPSAAPVRAAARRAHAPCPLSPAEADQWAGFLAPFSPHKAVLSALGKLRQAEATVVVTGQQAGLLGGPLLALHKALGAVRWARRLEELTAQPVVPVFWIASDDHDFAEVSEATWQRRGGGLGSFAVEHAPGGEGRPVHEQPFTSAIAAGLRARLAEDLAEAPRLAELLAFLDREAARPGASWESQFLALLLETLGPLGLVPVAPRQEWLRRRAASLVAREITGEVPSTSMLITAGRELEAIGATGRVLHRHPGDVNVFLHREGARWKLRREGDMIHATHTATGELGGSIAAADLAARALEHPDEFSPNAALRPLVQDLALPTAVFLGGPAEVVYHAQLKPLYEAFGVFRPIVAPRPGAALVEPPARRALEQLGFTPQEALDRGATALDEVALARAEGASLLEAIDGALGELEARALELEGLVRVGTKDPHARRAAERLRNRLHGRGKVLRARAEVAVRQSGGAATEAANRAAEALWPGGEPQERVVGWAGLLARHGLSAAAALAGHLELDRAAPVAIETTSLGA